MTEQSPAQAHAMPRRRKHLRAAVTSQRQAIRELTEANAALRGEAAPAPRPGRGGPGTPTAGDGHG